MAADGGPAHSSAGVLNLLQKAPHAKDLLHTSNTFMGTFDDQFAALCDAGTAAEKLRDEAKVKELRAQTQQLVEAHDKLHAHMQALQEFKNSYQCSAKATDFQAKLRPRDGGASGSAAAAANELEQRLQSFDRAVWNVHHAGEPMPGEDDDGLWVEPSQNEVAPNARCPLSGKNVLELKEPVKDNRGYVYEKAVITQYINAKLKTTPNASGAVDSPNIGASYKITLAELVPAKNVIRLAKRRQLASQQGKEHEDTEVIDD